MKVVQVTQFGEPSVLQVNDLPDPSPGPGEIAIDVTHAAVGLVDLFFRQGLFKDVPGMAQPPFVPGLEVTGTVRALGEGVEEFRLGESVVAMSAGSGTGGYASVYVAQAARAISLEGTGIHPTLAVSVIPNAAMAHVALTKVAGLSGGESVLIHGALGGLAAAFAGIAKQLGASRVVGTVRQSKLAAARATKLPYDLIVDSAELPGAISTEKFDVVIDPVGGRLRSHSIGFMRSGSRLIAAGNASGEWAHDVKTNDLWLNNMTVSGFNAGSYLQQHAELVKPALQAALQATTAGLCEIEVDVLNFDQASKAHQRMEDRSLNGRIVLTP